MKQLAVLEYAEAPHQLRVDDHPLYVDEVGGPKFTWWRVEADGEYSGVVDSIDAVRRLFLTSGPFDGLLGFSQGGSFVALLLQLHTAHRTARDTHTPLPQLLPPSLALSPSLAPLLSLDYAFLDSVTFALLFAAFIPRAPGLRELFLHPPPPIPRISQRTLHVMGEGDRNIELKASEELMSAFAHAEIRRHTGGHHVPSEKESRALYVQFIQRQRGEMGARGGDQEGVASTATHS